MHDAYKKNKIYYSFQRPKNCIFFLINIANMEKLNLKKHKVNDSTLKQATEYSFNAS